MVVYLFLLTEVKKKGIYGQGNCAWLLLMSVVVEGLTTLTLSSQSFTLTLILKVHIPHMCSVNTLYNAYTAAVEVLSEDPSIEIRESNWLRRSFRRSVRRLRKVPNSPQMQKEDDVDDATVDMMTEFVADDVQDGYNTGTVRLCSVYSIFHSRYSDVDSMLG